MNNANAVKIAVIEPGYPEYSVEKRVLAEFNPSIDVIAGDAPMAEKLARTRDVDALMVREAKVDKALIDGMERCRVIVRYGIGVDNIDQAAARERRIYVANVPRYGADEVSDHTLALLMAVSRWVVRRDKEVRGGGWGVGSRDKIYSFRTQTVGIAGFGSIAQRFLDKIRPLAFREILICSPSMTPERARELGARKVDLDTLCREAQVISLHMPLKPETRHSIDAARLALMSPETIILNTGRGALIDEAALVAALKSGAIRGAGLDVFEKEPPGRDNPLFAMDNVVVTDHAAWYSESSIEELQTKGAEEVRRVLAGGEPASWLNRW